MKTGLSSKHAKTAGALFLTLCFFVLIRLLFWSFSDRLGIDAQSARTLYPDSETYIAPAEALLESGRFLNRDGTPETVRTPGYPLLIALFMKLFGRNWTPALTLFQLILNAAACLLLIGTLKDLGVRPKISFMLGIAAILNLHDAYFALFVLSDSAAQSFFMFFLYFVVRALKEYRTRGFALAFAFLTGCIFIRPGSLFLPAFLILGIGVALLARGERKRIGPVLAAFLVLTVLPIGAWQLRNRAAGYNGFSAISDLNLYFYHNAAISAERNGTDFYDEQRELLNAPEYRRLLETVPPHTAQRQLALKTIGENIPLYLRLHVRGAALTLIYPGTFDIFRSLPAPGKLIASVREAYLRDGLTPDLIGEIVRSPFGLITLADMLLLTGMALAAGTAMVRALRARVPDPTLAAALIGIFLYNLAISAGPNGFGTYPRFRLTLSFLTLIWIGIGTIAKATPESPSASGSASGAAPLPPSSARS